MTDSAGPVRGSNDDQADRPSVRSGGDARAVPLSDTPFTGTGEVPEFAVGVRGDGLVYVLFTREITGFGLSPGEAVSLARVLIEAAREAAQTRAARQ